MDILTAIEILKDESEHCRHHLLYEGKADVYYKELGMLADALELAITVLTKQEANND